MRKYLIIFTLLPLLLSCEKELDFKYHDVESQLVIQAETTAEGTTVRLTSTTPMGEPMDNALIADAAVTLTDETLGASRTLSADAGGIFRDSEPGVSGHRYSLSVIRKEEQYTSKSQMLPEPELVGLEFQWINMPYDQVACLQISFLDPPTAGDCYWIRIYRNGEAYMWSLIDDRLAEDGIIHEVVMTSRKNPDDEDDKSNLVNGDVVSVEILPVSLSMLDYLIALENDSNGPQMFRGDFCLGYYLAAATSHGSIVFHPAEIKVFK